MEKNNFILITICSRPQYLEAIWADILKQEYNNFKWIICYDGTKPLEIKEKDERIISINYKRKVGQITNYAGLNYVYDYLVENKLEGFIHVIDDDNTIHPNYMNELNSIINDNLKFIYYQQSFLDGDLRFDCRTKNINEGHVDMAQVCFHSSLIEDTRYVTNKYTADGLFYQSIFAKVLANKTVWTIIKKPLCYYNALVNFTKYTPRLLKKKVNIDK